MDATLADIAKAPVEEITSAFKGLPKEDFTKLKEAMEACKEPLPTETPVFYYMPIAGRGELVRMIAKTGGLDMEDKPNTKDIDLASFGTASTFPVLQHGSLKLSQSASITTYIYEITPKFKGLTAAQKGKDRQFNGILDDIMDGGIPPVFKKDPNAGENAKAVLEKWFVLLEGLVPETGFVNGLDYPTGADYVCVILKEGYMPYNVLAKVAGIDPFEKCPKLKGLAERTMEVPSVKEYVQASKTLKANPFGF